MRDGSEPLFEPGEMPPKKGAGRPRLQLSKEKQRLIVCALRGGMSFDEIGTALGIGRTTLEKYFSRPAPTTDELWKRAERVRRISSELRAFAEDLLDCLPRDKGIGS